MSQEPVASAERHPKPRYVRQTVKVIRGREASARTRMEADGWELVSEQRGRVRSELTFRRVKPASLLVRAAGLWRAFRSLSPTIQRVLVGAAVLVLVGAGSAIALLGDGRPVEVAADESTQAPTPGTPSPTPSQQESSVPSDTPSASVSESVTPSPTPEPEPEPYEYAGPAYEIVVTDDGMGPARLTQYWVLVPTLSSDDRNYRKQAKQVITDLAIEQQSADLLVEIVNDEEIALAEAASTYQDFVAEHGQDYVIDVVLPKEVEGWIGSYSGGFDSNTGTPSTKPRAYEVIWLGYSDKPAIETWQPNVQTSS